MLKLGGGCRAHARHAGFRGVGCVFGPRVSAGREGLRRTEGRGGGCPRDGGRECPLNVSVRMTPLLSQRNCTGVASHFHLCQPHSRAISRFTFLFTICSISAVRFSPSSLAILSDCSCKSACICIQTQRVAQASIATNNDNIDVYGDDDGDSISW